MKNTLIKRIRGCFHNTYLKQILKSRLQKLKATASKVIILKGCCEFWSVLACDISLERDPATQCQWHGFRLTMSGVNFRQVNFCMEWGLSLEAPCKIQLNMTCWGCDDGLQDGAHVISLMRTTVNVSIYLCLLWPPFQEQVAFKGQLV